MNIELPLNEMSVTEKLKVFEALWEDLASSPETLVSPDWHEAVLEQRQRKIDSGESRFTDLQELKQRVNKRIK